MLRRLKRKTKRFLVLWYMRMKYRDKVTICSGCNVDRHSIFEGANKIYQNCNFSGSMGYGSYIAPNCKIHAHIGRFTSIAPEVECNLGTHPISLPYVTTSPMFFSNRRQNGQSFANELLFQEIKSTIEIGNDVWIGQKVFMVGGIKIGDGAVVLAGAVVTKDVPPYAIVGGVPAKVVKYRYDDETIDFLLKIQWWNKDIEWLKEHWQLLNDMDKFKAYFDKT